jgi:glycosyltransferase involved in cell wall biosynthesis
MTYSKRVSIIQLVAGFSVEKPLGGIERFVFELCRHLDASRFSLAVYGLWNFEAEYKLRWMRLLNEAGIDTFEGSPWQPSRPYQAFIATYRMLNQVLKKHPFEIIHSHDQFGDIMAMLLKLQFSQVRLVRTAHNREWLKRPLRKALLWGSLYPWLYDAEIGVNQRIVDDLDHRVVAKLLGKKGYLVPNAVNLDRFKRAYGVDSSLKAEIGLPPDCVVVGSIGRLTVQKGYTYLLQAARAVLQKRQDVFFLIVGGGELDEDLRRQTQELGLAEHVIFCGPRADVERFIHVFDMFVSPSLWEGLPTVIMESMAAGIAVIATDIPGSRDLIRHQQNGWLAQPAQPAALAEAILLAANNQLLREQMAEQARVDVTQHSIQHSAALQEQVYRQIMEINR